MAFNKRIRFFYWFSRDLIKRYKRAIVIGFTVGLVATIIVGRLFPILFNSITKPVERIGIVGDISPSTLPLSIQNELSYGLTRLSSDGTVIPGIAKEWTIEDDGKQIIFTLNDLNWHDGEPVKATDINYNIEGVIFQAINQKTLKVILPEPYSPFLTIVTKPVLRVGLVGVGTYKVGKLKLKGGQIERLTLLPLNSTNSIKEYVVYRTEAQAILGYKRGEIDVIEDLSSTKDLQDWTHTKFIQEHNYNRIVALYFNLQDQLLAEKSLRQGLAYAIPDINEERAFSPIPKTSWAYSDVVRTYPFDLEQAKKLISGIKLPEESTLTITTFPQYVRTAQLIAEQWTQLGITTNVKVENAVMDQYQVLLSAQDLPPDPDQYPFWHSQQNTTNITKYINVRVDKLLEDGRREMDIENRKKIYADFQKFLTEDVPAIFLYHPKTILVKRD